MPPPENEVTTLQHLFDLSMIALSLGLGVLICGVLITWLLRRHFRRLDALPPPWYERNPDE